MIRSHALAALALLFATTTLPAQEAIWIEGESAASNVKPNLAGWGAKEILSGEKWLHYSVDADKVDQGVPPDGAVFSYKLRAPKTAAYQIWDRLGFEFARSPFSWRIDGREWKEVRPDELTTDLMELDFFCEVAWLRLGSVDLDEGEHTLEFRVKPGKDGEGKPARVLFACDALCLAPVEFRPNGKFPPGVDGRTERDRQAAETVFHLPEPGPGGARSRVSLNGPWEIARDDEQAPGPVAEPMKPVAALRFLRGIDVPGDKNTLRPDLVFAHRVWYRTRVDVPKSAEGRSFFLVFPQNNLNTTVYVNGVLCGFDKNPFARVQIDVTKSVKPGANELLVGIRDAWYGRSADPADPMKLRRTFNLPKKFFGDGFQDLAYPIWNLPQSGILVTPELVCAGPIRADDVFVRPSVGDKSLSVDLTLHNRGLRDAPIRVACEAVDASGRVVKALPPFERGMSAVGEEPITVSGPWPDAKPWWPGDPTMYRLRATVFANGRPVDVSETPFGFREWSTKGKDFLLNGRPWHGWADTHNEDTKEEWLDFHRKTNQTFTRFWGTDWKGMPPEEALSWFDRSGVVVRRSGILDGEAIGYHAVEQDPKVRERRKTDIKMDLLENWRDQMVAQVKGERNHPSVMIWSIENEYLYINCINIHGDKMDAFEDEVVKTAEAVAKADPTRPTMTDGGGATKSNRMPVHGDHYTAGPFWEYPTLAYTANAKGGGRGRWEWDQQRPRFIGEELFAEGFNPAYSYFGGEEVFSGKAGARRSVGMLVRMMTEGARWTGNGAIHFWQGPGVAVGQYDANAPRAVFCRQWDWTIGSGGKLKRTLRLFDETHDGEPMIFRDALVVNGRELPGLSTESGGAPHVGVGRPLVVEPGTRLAVEAGTGRRHFSTMQGALHAPDVSARTEAQYVMTLSAGGREVFRDAKAVSILPAVVMPEIRPGELVVYDPSSSVKATLSQLRVPFTEIRALDALPDSFRVLLVGTDALSPSEAASPALAAHALAGRRVVVLDQRNPLRYQSLGPAEMDPAENAGRIAHVEDASHPAMRGLLSKDFVAWGDDELVYRNAYLKPTKNARSIVQCHDTLKHSAMVEVPIGKGLLLVSQLSLGRNLGTSAVAKTLLANLLRHASDYKQEFRESVAVVGGAPTLSGALDAIGVKASAESDPVAAIGGAARLVILHASPANLAQLADNLDALAKFKARGGYLVLNGLTPEGLGSFNKIVGVEHMIRPFRRERVTFPPVRDPLGAGLSLSDVALYSSERIFPWQAGNYAASDTFSFVVDYDDVAPFARLFDRDAFAANMVNGFVSSDAWKYIVNLPAPESGPMDFVLDLPREQAISEVEWAGNTFYYPVTRFELIFDGKDAASFTAKPINDPQSFAVSPPRSGRNLTLRLAEWAKVPGKDAVTGLDNVRLKPARSTEFLAKVRPLVSNGGLMHYPDGPGGVVLCNVLFEESEDVPGNADKKRAILAAILRNLKAPFAGGKTIIAGAAMDYQPIDLSKQANAYRTERGWFGDPATTFRDLPTGKQTFAGVPFTVYDFPTSPVPTVVMLGGPGVPGDLPSEVRGIPVGRKADALFFLHAARVDKTPSEQEAREGERFEMARYVVTYEDGRTVDVPIVAGSDVDDYRARSPSALPGAFLGWSKPYAGSDLSAASYVKTWANPRPDAAIRSVDLVAGKDGAGVPALIAVTAATARP